VEFHFDKLILPFLGRIAPAFDPPGAFAIDLLYQVQVFERFWSGEVEVHKLLLGNFDERFDTGTSLISQEH
jgi:hypothetical protein